MSGSLKIIIDLEKTCLYLYVFLMEAVIYKWVMHVQDLTFVEIRVGWEIPVLGITCGKYWYFPSR